MTNNRATQAHQQRTNTTFFNLITPTHATVDQVLHKWAPDQDITKGLQQSRQQQFVVHAGRGPMDHDFSTLVIDR